MLVIYLDAAQLRSIALRNMLDDETLMSEGNEFQRYIVIVQLQ